MRFRIRSLMILVLLAAIALVPVSTMQRSIALIRANPSGSAFLFGPLVALAMMGIGRALAVRRKRYRPKDLKPLEGEPLRPQTGD